MNQTASFLHNRVAIVTGGASGIGWATVQAMAFAGAHVVIASRSAHRCLPEIRQKGLEKSTLVLDIDLSITAQVEHLHQVVMEQLGRVDILVNAVGAFPEHPLCHHPDELWHAIIDTNLNSVYRTCKLCLPTMIQQKWGRIINIASTAASIGSATFPAYSAAKAAVVSLSRCIALEGAPHKVTCNAISPGWVETDTAMKSIEKAAQAEGRNFTDYLAEIKQSNPQKRIIQPSEIAHLALFLCQEASIGITMQELTVSAGSLW